MSRLRAQGLIADRDEEGVAADARSRRAAVALALTTTRRPSEQGRDEGERLTAMARPRRSVLAASHRGETGPRCASECQRRDLMRLRWLAPGLPFYGTMGASAAR